MTQAKLKNIVKIVTVCATVLLFLLVCIVVGQYIKMGILSSRNSSLDAKINELSITKANLEQGIIIRSSDSFIEQQAREELGMIKSDGEYIYIIK